MVLTGRNPSPVLLEGDFYHGGFPIGGDNVEEALNFRHGAANFSGAREVAPLIPHGTGPVLAGLPLNVRHIARMADLQPGIEGMRSPLLGRLAGAIQRAILDPAHIQLGIALTAMHRLLVGSEKSADISCSA